MNDLSIASIRSRVAGGETALPRPTPRVPITVRAATPADVPFIDALQKRHAKQVGWMPTAQLEGKIGRGHVLVAEAVASCELPVARGEEARGAASALPSLATSNSQLATPAGYCIGTDQYFNRDDVGIIYQMNVAPGRQRGLVGATLLRAMFDRAAYGCRLFCCWCAQDIAANRFWEAMGFVPLAYRAGSRGKGRTHVFWQRRIRAGDTTTPYWFPAQTSGGSIREDRLVLPIPPGTHWGDAVPIVLPGEALPVAGCQLPEPGKSGRRQPALSATGNARVATPPATIAAGGLRFAPAPASPEPAAAERKREPKRKTTPIKAKNDPRLVAAARELRDRWLEQVNAGAHAPEARGKYDVSRALPDQAPWLDHAAATAAMPPRALPAVA